MRRRLGTLSSFPPEEREYWLGFDEWFAEQVARWATTSERPLSVIDKFFKRVGDRIRAIVEAMRGRTEERFEAAPAVAAWLDSFLAEPTAFGESILPEIRQKTARENAAALEEVGDDPFGAPPQTGATLAARNMLSTMFSSRSEVPFAHADAAHVDRMNKFHEYGLGVIELAKINPHLHDLQLYREDVQLRQLMIQRIQDQTETILKEWGRLSSAQDRALGGLLDDYMNMMYRSPTEVELTIARHPTPGELQRMVRDNGVDEKGFATFQKIVKHYADFINMYETVLVDDAERVRDPGLRGLKQDAIRKRFALYRESPPAPTARFGLQ
jgi:hypothetical protein